MRALALVLALAVFLAGCGTSVGRLADFLASTYERVDDASVPNAAPDTRTYRSPEGVDVTADTIATAVRPADRIDQANGTFLRYPGAIVGVVPGGEGAFVTLDDEDTGRARWIPIIGPVFGFPGGRGPRNAGGGFRGGGPGFGK